jgi:hypothetical protein
MVVEGAVVLTDAAGKPVGIEKHQLSPGEHARLIASYIGGSNESLIFAPERRDTFPA